jgi:hypothetical protein
MACFVQNISVGPRFEWKCALCGAYCGKETPIILDKFLMSVLESKKENTRQEFIEINSDGEICDDGQDDSDSILSDHEDEEEEEEDDDD